MLKADEEAFGDARAKDTVAAYDGYLGSYAAGEFVHEAERLRSLAKEREADHAAFLYARESGSASAYEAYINSYPRGKNLALARRELTRLAEIERDLDAFSSAKTIGDFETYLVRFPTGENVERSEEENRGAEERGGRYRVPKRRQGQYKASTRAVLAGIP